MELKQSEFFLTALAGVYCKGEKTLLAFSGGADSTALFYLLLAYQKIDSRFYFEAFHLNHRFRGKESEQDAGAVANLCGKHQIKLHLQTEEVGLYAKKNGLSFEEAGRVIRYRHCERILLERKLESITTAHHGSDQVETFLMRLFTGGGLSALGGMKPRMENRVKPLLEFSKAEILDFLKQNRLDFREDSSNAENLAHRNRIRNVVLPLILENFPSAAKKIQGFQRLLQEREGWVQSLLLEWNQKGFEVFTDLDRFLDMPDPLRKDFLLKGLKTLNQAFYIRRLVLEKIHENLLSFKGQGHQILLQTKKFAMLVSQKEIFFMESGRLNPPAFCEALYSGELRQDFGLEILAKEPVILRTPETGERVCFSKTRKLQDFLVDEKVHFHRRGYVRIMECPEGFCGVTDPLGQRFWLTALGEKKVKISKADPQEA